MAIENYDSIIKINSEDIETYREKANIYKQLADIVNKGKKKNYILALKCYDAIIKLNSNDKYAYEGKSKVLTLLNKNAEAKKCIKIANNL